MASVLLGTPNTRTRTRLLLLGAGELGKEVALEAQRLGVEVIAADRYASAPAMQVAHRSHVLPMLDAEQLEALIEAEQPDFVVPEIEAIATDVLLRLEARVAELGRGPMVIPTARAASLTMNREGIRRLAAEELQLQTSPYRFVDTESELREALGQLGYPAVIKPVMSSSGKGQSVVRSDAEVERAFRHAQEGGRAGGGRMIVEGFVDFDYEITLLTVRHVGGITLCAPIGHRQVDGDYQESWQPQPMSEAAYRESERIARSVVEALGGRGLFGVELFVKGDTVWFSEVSPRPHDTGMVTLVSQDLSEFALHVRAILGFPVPEPMQMGPSASAVVLGDGDSDSPAYAIDPAPLAEPSTQLRLFGKPEVHGHRRLGVALARGATLEAARTLARAAAAAVTVKLA